MTTDLFPDADDTDGNWTNELGGTTLFASIDETTASFTDYIQSGADPNLDVCKIRLSNPPGPITAPATLNLEYQKFGVATGIDLRVRLLEGTTEIAAWDHPGLTGGPTTLNETITGPQLAAITDPNNLFVELRATANFAPTPITIFGADLVAWFDATTGVYSDAGVTPATNGQDVSQWNDLSGNNYHLVDASNNLPSLNTTGLNSLPGIVFDVANSESIKLTSNNVDFSSSAAASFVVAKFTSSSGSNGRFVSVRNTAGVDYGSGSFLLARNGGENILAYTHGAGADRAATYNSPSVFGITVGTNEIVAYVDNVGTANTGSLSPSFGSDLSIQLGAFHLGDYIDGVISEAVFLKAVPTSGQLADFHDYAAAKWGL